MWLAWMMIFTVILTVLISTLLTRHT